MGVVKLADYRPQLEVVEHRVAELEDGYTRTANTLLEAAMLSGLTLHQLLIVMAVWRKTYGYNKKIDWIGNDSSLNSLAWHQPNALPPKTSLSEWEFSFRWGVRLV